jgi:hypothetical protein
MRIESKGKEKMNYEGLFRRAWDIVWKNRFLIILGALVVIGGGSGADIEFSTDENGLSTINFPLFNLDLSNPFQGFRLPAAALVVGGLILLVAFFIWAIGAISRGGLIFGADTISKGGSTNFSESFRAGLAKAWRLIGIGLIPILPVLLLMLSAVIGAGIYTNRRIVLQEGMGTYVPNAAVVIPVTALLLLLVLFLSILRTFANRACMLEDRGVFSSYRRGLQVLGNNLGPAAALFLLQILVSLVFWFVLLLPSITIMLCCLLWPLMLVIQGAFASFYSTLWTLTWNQWTDTAS